MISLSVGDALFNYRAAGVAILNNKVLMHKTPRDNFWSLPGGRAELFEFSNETVVREMHEETGLEVAVGDLLWVSENFFVYNHVRHHEIGFYYKMQIHNLQNQDDFIGTEGNDDLLFKWIDLSEIASTLVYPRFLVEELVREPLRFGNFNAGFEDLDNPLSPLS